LENLKGKTLDVAVVLCAFVALKVAVFAGLLWVYFELWEKGWEEEEFTV
jgi:hypothetical protein